MNRYMDKRLDDALNTVIAALRGTEAARLLTEEVGGGVERLRWERAKAISLLHMLDHPEARHRDQLWTNFVRAWREIAREIRWPGISDGTYHSTWCTCCDGEKDNARIEAAAARPDAEGVETMDGILDEADICRLAKSFPACGYEDGRAWYAATWEHIHGSGSWERDRGRWVFATTFRRMTR